MLILALVAALAAPAVGKTMALDDWHAMTILAVGQESPNQPPFYLHVATGDLDGDGLPDEAYLKLVCAGGAVQQAFYTVQSPKDVATGQASGKRMHKPITFVKEWCAASPQLRAVRPTYNVKNMVGTRSAMDDWMPLSLRNTDGLCPATEAAAAAIVKSKSNITNN
jgi:hypothetical protein